MGKQLNLPPSYLLIHRVTLSTIGVLCQLEATVRMRDELEEWLPGFVPAKPAATPAEQLSASAEEASVAGATAEASVAAAAEEA